MELTWFYYSDTNASGINIESVLKEREYELRTIPQLDKLLQELKKTNHSVLFLKTNTVYNIYELCQQISAKYPHVYIILIAPDNMENQRKAMLAGASNIIRYSTEPEEIMDVINQAFKFMRHRQDKDGSIDFYIPKENSRVISVCSAKGGLGRTTTVVNLATALAKQGQKVVIIDADLQFGDVAVYLDLKPKYTIYEWVKERFEKDPASIEDYLIKHDNGVSILAAPSRPEFFEIITEIHISTAIEELKKIYDVVLVDTSAYLSEILLKCLTESQEVLLLTTRDLPALRNSKLLIDALDTLNLNEKIRVVLTKEDKNKKIDYTKTEKIIQRSIYATMPNQEVSVSLAINEGIPLVAKSAANPLSKSIMDLAQKFSLESLTEHKPKREKTRRFLVKK